ncbi:MULTISPECIES: PQQ-binding-like beta-propeller repeat protein [Halorussus]|uniref:outer membrane protein assembly factor BamB family protein n=1 Tax=Halorussus TaxID=1070314 RepID=UPI00209F1082|nr:PQQ-binding-like beta-propeller repeat protein [Halorussus vallis]USZ73863.1 PQQ-binding-like beta-propeller repeat protein [Halorussus vallis]
MCPREIGRRAFLGGFLGGGSVARRSGAADLAAGMGASASVGVAPTPAFEVPGVDADHSIRWRFNHTSGRNSVYPTVEAGGTTVCIVRNHESSDDEPRFWLYGLSTADGSVRWKNELRGYPSVPEIAGDAVLANWQDGLRAYDVRSGEERWRFEKRTYGGNSYSLAGGTLYLASVERGSNEAKSAVHAVDLTDGGTLWTKELPEEVGAASPQVVAGDAVYLSAHGGVLALDRAGGERRWLAELGENGFRPVECRGDALYVWGRTEMLALDAASGAERWRTSLGEGLHAHGFVGTVTDATVYVWEDRLFALNAADGGERWTFDPYETLDANETPDSARGRALELRDGVLYGITGRRVHAVDADSGTERWRFDSGQRLHRYWGGVRDGLVYVIDESSVAVLDADSGEERWRFGPPFGGPETGTESETTSQEARGTESSAEGQRQVFWAEVTDGTLYAGLRSGTLCAVDRPSPLATAPVATTRRYATSGPGLVALGLLGTGLLAAGYRRARRSAEPDYELGLLDRVGERGETETYRKRVETPDGPAVVAETRLVESADADTREAFVAGVERWANLDGRGVLPIRDYGTDPVPWFETPYASGGSLGDAWPLAREARVEAASAAARALHRAHGEGVVHGRLAPSTILLPAPGDGANAAVAGWFLGDALGDPMPGYAPPEQRERDGDSVAGADGVGPATDIYRVGALAYHLLTGAVPRADPRPPSERNPALSTATDDVLTTALAADPADRHGSALAFDDRFRWAALDR